MEGRAVSGPFADLQRDDLSIEHVRHYLPPEFGFRAAAGRADLRGLYPEFRKPPKPVIHPQGHAFHGRPRKVAGLEGPLVHPEPNAGAVGDIRRALAFKVRQQEQVIRARLNPPRLGGVAFVSPAEILAHHLGRHRHVHRAEQRQPAIRRVTKSGDFSLRVDHRFFGTGVNRAAGAQAGGDDTRARIAGADGAHHVVPAAGADERAGIQIEQPGRGGLQAAGRPLAAHQRRQFLCQFRINCLNDFLRPLAPSHVQ